MFHKVIHRSFRGVIKTGALSWMRTSRPCPALVPESSGQANRPTEMQLHTEPMEHIFQRLDPQALESIHRFSYPKENQILLEKQTRVFSLFT